MADRVDSGTPAVIGFGPAAVTWLLSWIASGFAAVLVLAALGSDADDRTPVEIAVTSAVVLAVLAAGAVVASRRFGTANPRADYAIAVRPIDAVAVAVGALGQLVLVPALYVPLRAAWPQTFSESEVEERAKELVGGADGWRAVLLVLVVVIGAPIAEEIVYRGLLQRSMATVVGRWPALAFTALWFAIIHISPVEIPGLFVAGLLFGGCLAVTGRLGPAMLAHAAFNAVGFAIAVS